MSALLFNIYYFWLAVPWAGESCELGDDPTAGAVLALGCGPESFILKKRAKLGVFYRADKLQHQTHVHEGIFLE